MKAEFRRSHVDIHSDLGPLAEHGPREFADCASKQPTHVKEHAEVDMVSSTGCTPGVSLLKRVSHIPSFLRTGFNGLHGRPKA